MLFQMISLPWTTRQTRWKAFKKACVWSLVVAALTCNPLHALAHLPIATLKNKVACFTNPLLNITTDVAICLGTDQLIHSLTDHDAHSLMETLDSWEHSDHIDHQTYENSINDHDHFEAHDQNDYLHHNTHDHSEHFWDEVQSHVEHWHEYNEHNHHHEKSHGLGVAIVSSIAEEWQQVSWRLKNQWDRGKMRFKKILSF